MMLHHDSDVAWESSSPATISLPAESTALRMLTTHVRVEFLLKTDSGYPRDAEVTWNFL